MTVKAMIMMLTIVEVVQLPSGSDGMLTGSDGMLTLQQVRASF
jgi:hypothetical protein